MTSLGPGEHPHVYRPTLPYTLLFGASGLAIMAIAVWRTIETVQHPDPQWPHVAPYFCAAFAPLGMAVLYAVATSRIVIRGDEIELRQLGYGSRRLRRDEIRGYRILPTRHVRTLVLERKDGGKPMKLGLVYRQDAFFHEWLGMLPNLDVQEYVASAGTLLADVALGATDESRRSALAHALKVARALEPVTLALAVWAVFYPHPRALVIVALAVLPLVALGVLSTGGDVYRVSSQRNDARAVLAAPLLLPGWALAFRGLSDVTQIDHLVVVVAGAMVALTLASAIASTASTPRGSAFALGAMLFTFALYGGGLAVETNALCDWHAPVRFEARVLRGWTDRDGSFLRLAPWGPVDEVRTYQVTPEVRDGVGAGDVACVQLHAGALGARWCEVGSCQ